MFGVVSRSHADQFKRSLTYFGGYKNDTSHAIANSIRIQVQCSVYMHTYQEHAEHLGK